MKSAYLSIYLDKLEIKIDMPLPDEKSGRIWPQENLKNPTR
jgi:hypothetical protein